MLVADLLDLIEKLAPARLALSWDNSGLLVGDESRPVSRVLCSLEMTRPVLDEVVSGSFDTVLTHHPLLFKPLRSLLASRPRERLVRELIAGDINLVACHTNLDAASGGIADLVASGLGLRTVRPMELSSAGWMKLVGFIPPDAVGAVAEAVFSAGAGGVGRYGECAFACAGTGWFTPGEGSDPTVGQVGRPERTAEMRWETVVARDRLMSCVSAFIDAHPYEEPAFDVYPVEDVLLGLGVGRVGELQAEMNVRSLAEAVRNVCGLSSVAWSGDGERPVGRVGVLPGSGRGALDAAVGLCDVLITGDLGYHDADEAGEKGLSLIDAPHGEIEWWAFRLWCERLREKLGPLGVEVVLSESWCPAWTRSVEKADGERGCGE